MAMIGASVATFLPLELLKPVVIVVLTLVMIYTLVKRTGAVYEHLRNLV